MRRSPRRSDRTELLVRAAETAILIGEYRLAVELGRSAIAGVDPALEPARAAALHERQRWYLWEAGDRAAAAAALAEAERLVPTRAAVGGARAHPRPQGRDPAVRWPSRGVDPRRRGSDRAWRGRSAPRRTRRSHSGSSARPWRSPGGSTRASTACARGSAIAEAIQSAGGHRARRDEPGHPARPGRPDRRCARGGRRRLGAGADDRRRTNIRRAAAGDRGQGRHRPRSLGRGRCVPGDRAGPRAGRTVDHQPARSSAAGSTTWRGELVAAAEALGIGAGGR